VLKLKGGNLKERTFDQVNFSVPGGFKLQWLEGIGLVAGVNLKY